MKPIIIIPARYHSSRFEGKPLAMIGTKPMIQHVYERALEANRNVMVATDDKRIFDVVKQFGGEVIMTGAYHKSGTERCAEAITKITGQYDIVINLQGDEPFIDPTQIKTVISILQQDENAQIATLIKQITTTQELFDPNIPKVVTDIHGYALYFSRQTIPYVRDRKESDWLSLSTFFKHIGIYGYRTNVLKEISTLQTTIAEKAESLEQLRWLQHGYNIKTAITYSETISVDTPEDLQKAIEYMENIRNI